MQFKRKAITSIDQSLPKEEKRKLEQVLLVPEKLVKYSGTEPGMSSLGTLSVSMIFPNKKALDLFSKHFPVSKHISHSVSNISKVMALVYALESGVIKYEKNTNGETVVICNRTDPKGKIKRRRNT